MIDPNGQEVQTLLHTFFQEDTSQRPEFSMGFIALRRRELLELAGKANIKIPGNTPKDQILTVMNGALVDGRFDSLIKQVVQGQSQGSNHEVIFWNSIKDSKYADDFLSYIEKYPNGSFAALAQNALDRFGGESLEKSAWMTGLEVPLKDSEKSLEKLSIPPKVPEEKPLDEMKFAELRTIAKGLGINCLHMSGVALREQIVQVRKDHPEG